jgi:hypothetical protein
MASVGLLYVGAVLIVNGLMLLGWVDSKAAAPLNLFVGALQVVTPTYLIFAANGDAPKILAASGIYLFGFTYLYVGINLMAGLDGTGLGWYSLFVAVAAVVYSGINFVVAKDAGFGVIWLMWAFLWTVTTTQGVLTAIPAFMLLLGLWTGSATTAVIYAVLVVLMAVGLLPLARRRPAAGAHTPAPAPRTPVASG